MNFSTERLEITTICEGDAVDLHAALDHPEVGRFISGPDVTTVIALRNRIGLLLQGPGTETSASAWFNFVVRRDGQVIGRLEATVYEGWAEVAWVFGTPFWGQGYGREAAAWLVEQLESQPKMTELWATVDPRNLPSIAILHRLDFTDATDSTLHRPASYEPGDRVFVRRANES